MGADQDFSALLQEVMRLTSASLYVAMPGVVVSYDRELQRASVQPPVSAKWFTDDRTENRVWDEVRFPVLPKLPVVWTASSAGSLVGDLNPGDPGLIIICDRDISRWLARGGDEVVAPDLRLHDLTDGVFLPGLHSDPGKLPAAAWAAGAFTLRGADVRLGDSTAADPVVTESRLRAALQDEQAARRALEAKFLAHVHAAAGALTSTPQGVPVGVVPEPPVDPDLGFGPSDPLQFQNLGSPHVKAT